MPSKIIGICAECKRSPRATPYVRIAEDTGAKEHICADCYHVAQNGKCAECEQDTRSVPYVRVAKNTGVKERICINCYQRERRRKRGLKHKGWRASCKHLWIIGMARGPASEGVCKFCGAIKPFPNSLEGCLEVDPRRNYLDRKNEPAKIRGRGEPAE